MESLILAIYYRKEKNKYKLEKVKENLIKYIKNSPKKYKVKIKSRNDIATIFIIVDEILPMDYYLNLIKSNSLKNKHFNPKIISLIGNEGEILNTIKSGKLDLKLRDKVLMLQGDDYFAL